MQKITMPMEVSKNFLEVFEMFITSQTAKGVADITIRNYRYNMKKRTIISSEKDIVKLNQIDVGISSRIQQMAGQYIIRINESPKNNWRAK